VKIMAERSAADRKRALEDLKAQLELTDEEWAVIKPRLQAVYDLLHPVPQFGLGSGRSMTPIDQKRNELRELLRNKDATPEQIKSGLSALRSAKLKADQDAAKAKQDLRQLLTLRQEATLVLNGLLD